MTINEKVLIELAKRGYTRKKIAEIKEAFGNYGNVYLNLSEKRECAKEKLGEKMYNELSDIDINETEIYINNLNQKGISIITEYSEDYPEILKNIDDRPLVLFCKGNTSLLKAENIIAIVGTRKPTNYGRDVTELFSKELASVGVVIVSGLAYGIDAEAGRSAVEVGGKTIAILGGGVNKIYPSSNIPLANKIIANGGLLVSEYLPDESPRQYHFPERNRIISGLSKGVLIIEAGENSGSLITAGIALDQNKEIFVVPANITSTASYGSNKLIHEYPECMVMYPQDILDRLHIERMPISVISDNLELTNDQRVVYDLLRVQDLRFDDIANKIKLSPNELNTLLTEMELFGIIKKKVGNYYGI